MSADRIECLVAQIVLDHAGVIFGNSRVYAE